MEYRILGPLEVADGEHPVALAAGRERAVLILLLLRAPDPVAIDAIVDALWPDVPPASAGKAVQNYILRLRKALGHGVILTVAGGYALRLGDSDTLDTSLAAALFADGNRALRRRDATEANRLISNGLALWRGDALADVRYADFAQPELSRLEELRLSAIEDRNDAQLLLGEHARLIPELEQQVGQHPARERTRGQLMLALYRSGRQADALAAYQATRQALRERGLEPSRALRDLEIGILNHDPDLEPPPTALALSAPGQRRRRALATAVAIMGAVLVVVVVYALVHRSSEPPVSSLRPDSVAEIDARNGRVKQSFAVGRTPTAVALTSRAVWVTSFDDRTVTRINLGSHTQTTTGTPSAPTGLAADDTGVWVISSFDGTVERLDESGAGLLTVLRVDRGLTDVASDHRGVWVTNQSAGSLTRIDPRTDEVHGTLTGLERPIGVAVGAGRAWVAEAGAKRIDGINPATGRVALRIPLQLEPGELAFGNGRLWATNPRDATVTRIDPYTGQQRLVSVGTRPSHIAIAQNQVWVTVDRDHSLIELDGTTGAVKRHLTLSTEATPTRGHATTPGGIATAHHSIWMSVQGY